MLVKNEFDIWQIDLTVNGERVRKSTKTKDKAVATKVHAILESQMVLGEYGVGKTKLSLQKAFDNALRDPEHWKGKKSVYKIVQNWELLKAHIDVTKDVSSIDAKKVREIRIALEALGNSPATINRKMAVLRALLNMCVEWGVLTHAPKIKALDEPEGRHRVLSAEEESAMMTFFSERHPEQAGLFEFLVSSGCRLSEALKLTWFDINFKNGTVVFLDTKSSDNVYKPLTDSMKRVLETRKHLAKPFPYTVDMVESWWKQFRTHAGMQEDPAFVIHCLRHTCASNLLAQGVDLKRIQLWLGHKSYTTTENYAKTETKHLSDVVNVLNKFDRSLSSVSQSKVIAFK